MAGNLEITLSDRLRKSPYYEATLRSGAKSFTIYNHMLMPVVYEGTDDDYWNLINNVTLWDVAAERQVCLLYTSPSPRDPKTSRMPSSA